MSDQDHKNKGILITFEGDDGVGKTTHINFLSDALKNHGLEVINLREPGGTCVGEKLRDIVLDTAHGDMAGETELLIYEAARAQIVSEIIKPALQRGAVVLCDRFYDSSVAYQGYGRGLDLEFIHQANAFATHDIVPDRTFLMTRTCVEETLGHIIKEEDPDRLELAGLDFHDRVRYGFDQLAEENPDRIIRIDAGEKRCDTAAAIFSALFDLFPWMDDDSVYNADFFRILDDEYDARVAARAKASEKTDNDNNNEKASEFSESHT